ncbi:MAG: DUF1385 domain-containing protein [Halanaerobiales bacterium]
MSDTQYGGQAVIEGIMMRGKERIAIAVRKAPDNIVLKKMKAGTITRKYSFLKWYFVRGIVALISSLAVGIKALSFSASQVAEEEDEKITPLEMAGSIIIAFGFAIVLFVIIPAGIVSLIQPFIPNNIILNMIEGIIKISAFLSYLFVISRLDDINRVFMYHGAEHKVIYTHENGLPLTVDNARQFSTLHPRCGTNFIFIVIILSIFFFSFFGRPPLLLRILYHLLLLPIIAGTSYEIIKMAGQKNAGSFIRAIAAPGLYLQKLTTREPDDSMLEVAITALKAIINNKENNDCKEDKATGDDVKPIEDQEKKVK